MSGVLQRAEVDCVILEAISPNKEWKFLEGSVGSITRENLSFFLSRLFLVLSCLVFIYFWLHWVFLAARGLSLGVASGGYSSLSCVGFSLWWLLLLWNTGSRYTGFSNCGAWAQ